MSILRVSRMGHPILRRQAAPIDRARIADPDLQRLVDDMIETMIDHEGIGLAAPQVFQSLRLIVLGDPEVEDEEEGIPLIVLFNPELTALSEKRSPGWEGCLSIPDVRGVVPRFIEVTVRGLDRGGQQIEFIARDFFARVLQHEVDHLDGVLFPDRMDDLNTLTYLEEYRRYWLSDDED